MTIELVAEFKLPCVCLCCHQIYKYIPASRPVLPGEVSHGYCPVCTPAVEERLFGKRISGACVEGRA